MKRLIALALCAMFNLSNVQAAPFLMGYWENWDEYNNFPMPNNAKGEDNPYLTAQLTGLNALAYAFLEVAPTGAVSFNDAWSDLDPNSTQDQQFCQQFPESCPGFPAKAGIGNFIAFSKAPIAHHVVSIGGAGHDDSWETAFRNPDRFIASLVADEYPKFWRNQLASTSKKPQLCQHYGL